MSSSSDSEPDRVPSYVRQFVFERDDWQCQTCGSIAKEKGGEVPLEIHHKVERQNGGGHDPKNLSTLCQFCHRKHHGGTDPEEVPIDVEELSVDITPADCAMLKSIDEIGPSTISKLAEKTGYSGEHLRRRAYCYVAEGILAVTPNRRWDFADEVDSPVGGTLPNGPNQAARATRDEIIRRLLQSGMSPAEVGELLDLDPRTVRISADRARAFDWPLPTSGVSSPSSTQEAIMQIFRLASWIATQHSEES